MRDQNRVFYQIIGSRKLRRVSIQIFENALNDLHHVMEMEIPRDRKGEYEPQIIKKYQNTLTQDMEEKIISMYAKGMTMARHGGGAFSGKDCTKVDRSAAYAARYVAKNVVAAGLADKCEIQLAYAIGVARPVSIMVETFGTAKVAEDLIADLINKNFDLRPAGIIKALDLRRPIYAQTAAYGHFGRTDVELPWEKTDKAAALKQQAGL